MNADLSAATTAIDGLLVFTMKQVSDERGTVREFYRQSAYGELAPGIGPWRQVNVTETKRGAMRGMHGEAMTKLIAIVEGEAFGAWVDARRDSPTYTAVVTQHLTKGTQVLVPPGVCNGFQALTDTQYLYCFDAEWVPGMTGVAVNPLDPALGIEWPLPIDLDDPSQISAKDSSLPALADL